jgi:hypothetical protein
VVKLEVRRKIPSNVQISPLTQGFLIDSQKYNGLLISNQLPKYNETAKNSLIIYAIYQKYTRITCYPTDFSVIWKLHIIINKLNVKTVETINNILENHLTVHTTGICEKNDQILVENYLSPLNSDSEAETIINSIKKLPNVKNCVFEILLLNDFKNFEAI